MRDDITPTNPEPIEVLAAQLEALRKHPDDGDLYFELRAALRKSGQAEPLAEIGELHAPFQKDQLRAANIWSEAGEARLLLGHDEQGERDLRRALQLDPANERAAARIAELLMVAERFAEAAEILERELEALADRAEAAPTKRGKGEAFATRRAHRHRMLAQLWDERLGRVDRALYHWQRAWHLEPDKSDALEAARAIYQGLGDDKMVVRLYEAELDVLGERGSRSRRARIELELGRLIARQGDLMVAAGHLEIALRLDPESTEAREALAEIYASAEVGEEQDRQRRASELFVDLGRRRLSTSDDDAAIGYLRRALGVDPYSRAAIDALEKALIATQRWEELDRLYRHLATVTDDERALSRLLTKRAQLYERHMNDRAALKEVLSELSARHAPGNEYDRRLRTIHREDEDWAELAALLEREIQALSADPSEAPRMCAELLELATIVREHLGERDRAAEHLHRVLTINPNDEEALARYGDHFRERRDWRGLADLLEFAFDNARDAGAPPGELVRRLEELAQIAELRLGDVERAAHTWQRIQQIEPANPKAREALRRLMSRAKMWESLVGVLEQEAQNARSPAERAEALRRIAQVYRERQVNPRRAIALYEEVISMFPGDEAALKALAELYEREGDDAGLAHTVRRQLELDVHKLEAELDAQGKRAPTAREWPVAKRVERLTALRRLASMYEQRLADVDGVVFACGAILEILPGDRDALERMERVLEKAGDTVRLEQTLEYHAESATGPAERAKVLRRLARLAAERDDEVASMERWEQVLKAAPSDSEALEALAVLYERHSRWGELAAVLERSLMTAKEPAASAERTRELQRYARVVDEHLGDRNRALRAWQRVIEVAPTDREALEALARTYEEAGRWRDLSQVLEAQAPLYAGDEPQRAAAVALRRARLLEERLGAPAEAAKALEALLRDLDPGNLEAHKALRRLYEARGDFEAAVRIAEREMYLSKDNAERISRGLEIGFLCRDRIADPTRALQAFERVLELEPEHEEALAAASDLYAKVGDWRSHIRLLERRIDRAPAGRERRALMMRAGQATAERLEDHRGAFRWFRRAHEHAPDATTIAELRRAAEAYGLWRELADVYAAELEQLSGSGDTPNDVAAFISASRELAGITERRLNNRRRAMSVLFDAICIAPRDDGLISEAERIALEANQRPVWMQLLDCLEASLEASPRSDRVIFHIRRARILEEQLEDAAGAVSELLKAFSWEPERNETRSALYELAERTRSWSDIVGVEAALFERATTIADRVEILRRKAQIIEDRLHDRVRAFRIHLQAFLMAPEDSDTVAHLWRLGRAIGSYRESDRRARPEPAPAYVVPDQTASRQPRRKPAPKLRVAASTPVREATQELSISDLILARGDTRPSVDDDAEDDLFDEPIAAPSRQDQTMPIDLSDLEDFEEPADDDEDEPASFIAAESAPREDATMELRVEDLIEALGSRSAPPPPARKPTPPARQRGAPPPPPPRPPQIQRMKPSARRAPPRSVRKAAPKKSRGARMPERAYESAWEEFATAYDVLPAIDIQSKLRWLFRAAEVWETGAEDIGRAFDTLARALEIADDDTEPRDRLYRLASDHDQWDRLAELYELAAEEADSASEAVALFSEVATIRAQQDRPRETEALFRRILGMRPDDAATRKKLEALYRSESRWIDLAASLEERTDPRLGTAAPESERPALLRELASIYSDKLDRKHDAIEALERLRGLDPEDPETLRKLADLYAAVGRWSKVIEVLGRIGEGSEASAESREALHRIADIYEKELELPDRAIDSYRQLVASWPDDAEAYAALDRLYASHARWEDLSDILRRRAALARDPDERAELLRRRAEVLGDWLDAPEEAAAALRHARTLAPGNDKLADALVRSLIAAGREREAAAVLEGRIAALENDSGGSGDIAALLIRLAQLRAEHLGNKTAARAALDKALELVPHHPNALATLARLAESEEDPRAYAEARLREAEAHSDVDAKVDALLAAGSALADRCDDIEGARAAFEKLLELRPYHAEATWALAGLIEHEGDPESAAALLEKRLESESLDAGEKTRILTQLAALAREAGVEAAAERRLMEALEITPDHLPAVIARADLLADAGRWEVLEAFLLATMPKLSEAPTAARAELHRRLAIAYEQVGDEDKAYEILLDADRIHRKHLLVKLALGENRYRARRWREAALHLGALAEHPDASAHPAQVAQGLYHAALAEIRSLRPEKAPALYERALELKPNFAPALHALAEIAMEQGNYTRAADLLTRQASATDNAGERMRLFEALGDMALMTMNDEDRARVCYESAVNAADPLEAKHLPLLEKLLERQDLAGDHMGAARTAELMASFGVDAEARAARFTSAAQSYLTGGDAEKARAAAERAVQADPYDVTAVSVLSEIMMDAGEFAEVAATLGRALSGGETGDELTETRKAQLWRRLAEARRARGDQKGATSAYNKCIQIAPDSDSAIGARRELIELWKDDAGKRETVLEYRRTIAADSRAEADVSAYAYALRKSGDDAGACAILQLLGAMGYKLAEAEQLFLTANAPKPMATDAAYRAVIDDAEREVLIVDEDDQPYAGIFRALWDAAALLWSEPDDALERCGVVGATRVSATSSLAAAAIFPRVAQALDIPATVLYATDVPDAPDIAVVCVSAPIIVLGPRLQGIDGEASESELRFLLGRAAELARPERIIAAGLPPEDLDNLVGSLQRVFGNPRTRSLASAGGDATVQKHHDELLRTTLPVKLRSRLDKLFADLRPADLNIERFEAASARAADRAGLLVSGDARVAFEHAGARGERRTRHLSDLILGPSYLPTRAKLVPSR